MTFRIATAAVAILLIGIAQAEARSHHHRHHHHSQRHIEYGETSQHDANGNSSCKHNTVKRSTAYGIDICVDPVHADKFVKFFALLKERGCQVKEIGCQAYGHVRGSNHLGGGACDVDQKRKNVTNACMYHAGDLIKQAGLYDGCSFHDCGHVEAMRGLGHYGGVRHYASRETKTYAARSHRHYTRARTQIASFVPPDRLTMH